MSQNKAFSTPFILAVLCIYFSYFLHGISVITLAQNMSSLAEKFSTDNAGIAYLISGIGLGRLISILFFGVISDKFGRRAVILMAVIRVATPRSLNAFRKPLVRRSYWLKRWCHLGKCSTQCW